jgi:sulfate adenylyltransferase
MLSLLPLAMRMAGPREALWHAIIRKNYGATHFIVGRDHAGTRRRPGGQSFYGPYEAQELLRRHRAELGVEILPFKQMVYLADSGRYVPEDEAPRGARVLSISGTQVRHRLAAGLELPHWYSPPEIAAELRRSCLADPRAAPATSGPPPDGVTAAVPLSTP